MKEIERLAKEQGLEALHLVSSVNAEPFYQALGYFSLEVTEFVLRNGVPMKAIRMPRAL